MCGRVIVDCDELVFAAKSSVLGQWMPGWPAEACSSWNIAPSQNIPIAATDPDTGDKHFDFAHWGILAPWHKDGTAPNTFNARVENVFEKRTFAPLLAQQRCAVTVSGFYEWTGANGARVPHAIFGPTGLIPMAGLYRWWLSPEGYWLLTATILTRSATGVMADIHNRMPVFLAAEHIADWLNPTIKGDQFFLGDVCAGAEFVAGQLSHYPVASLRGDGPELIQPVDLQAGSDLAKPVLVAEISSAQDQLPF